MSECFELSTFRTHPAYYSHERNDWDELAVVLGRQGASLHRRQSVEGGKQITGQRIWLRDIWLCHGLDFEAQVSDLWRRVGWENLSDVSRNALSPCSGSHISKICYLHKGSRCLQFGYVSSGVWQLLVWFSVPYAPPGGGLPLPSTFILKRNTFIISVYETSFSGICEEDDTYWRLGRQFKEPQNRKFTLLKWYGCVHPFVRPFLCIYGETSPAPRHPPPHTHTHKTIYCPHSAAHTPFCELYNQCRYHSYHQPAAQSPWRRLKTAVTDDRPQHRSRTHFTWFSVVPPGKCQKSALSGPRPSPTISVPNSSLTSPNLTLQSNSELRTASVKVTGNKQFYYTECP